MKLLTLSSGDDVCFYDKSIVMLFSGRRRVLSTSVYNGGYREDFTAVYNHDVKKGAEKSYEILADTYVEHMKLISKRLKLDPDKVSGMGTAASMENAVIETMRYKELTVTAIVTGGIDVNGGRVGDPSDNYRPVEKPDKFGTINIILFLDCDMPAGTLARALVTCTEAKTAAIQELLFGSNYSEGLATGSGTDQTIVVANAESDLYLEGAGKHNKLGELIGKVVIKAVKKALEKETGLNSQRQHSAFARLKRFGVTPEALWQRYHSKNPGLSKSQFLIMGKALATEENMLIYTSLYIHLLDQYSWQLIGENEVVNATEVLFNTLADLYKVSIGKITRVDSTAMVEAWSEMFCAVVAGKYKTERLEADGKNSL